MNYLTETLIDSFFFQTDYADYMNSSYLPFPFDGYQEPDAPLDDWTPGEFKRIEILPDTDDVIVSRYKSVSIAAGGGDDYVVTGAGHDDLSGAGGSDVLRSGMGNDNLDGGAGSDWLWAGDGDDEALGGTGNDFVHGGDGNDVVRGGRGSDFVAGGNGDDHIFGGRGQDMLGGGAGADAFHFKQGDGSDMVVDFDIAEDRLVFHNGIDGMDDLQFGQHGDDTVIDYGDGEIRLLDTDAATLMTEGEFVF